MLLNRAYSFFGILILCCFLLLNCETSQQEVTEIAIEESTNDIRELKILALGDSYTIGQGVCETCKFPSQLVSALKQQDSNLSITLDVIATTGWTTSDLLEATAQAQLATNYDLTTLLIGVNNQFRNLPFSLYEEEFPKLVDRAILASDAKPNRLVVLSIPDYAFTPRGGGSTTISEGIKRYNDFAKAYCDLLGITFLNITDITQEGLENPELVAEDGLHPSALAYERFVARLLPIAIEKLRLN